MARFLSFLRRFAEAAIGPVCALLLIPSFLLLAWHSGGAAESKKGETRSAPAKPEEPKKSETRTATLKPEDFKQFAAQPEKVRGLVEYALTLTAKNLGYLSASHDPAAGGMDCSGFVYHILQKQGHAAAPRQSNEMYEWVWKAGTFRACNGLTTDTFEFKELRPGDLLFWTYSTKDGKTDLNPPVTHVMIYLGERLKDGGKVIAGASDGRSYEGQKMCGVSVFDFHLPAPGGAARFIGYAHVPE